MASKSVLLVFTSILAIQFISAALPPSYDSAFTAQEKQDAIWSEISRVPYAADKLPTSNHGVFSMLGVLNPSFLTKAFTHTSDEMIDGRKKLIHSFGTTAKVSFNIFAGSPYTGIFQPGRYPALVRASVALIDEKNLIPGIGLKIFVDEAPSQNMFAMFGLDGQGTNFNFFANSLVTTIPDPQSFAMKALSQVFKLALWALPGGSGQRPEGEGNIPLYEHASVDAGSLVYAPYYLTLVPNAEVGWSSSDRTDFRTKCSQIPVGSVLWVIKAHRTKTSEGEVIGEIVTQSDFVASQYGDESLYFQHPSLPWKST